MNIRRTQRWPDTRPFAARANHLRYGVSSETQLVRSGLLFFIFFFVLAFGLTLWSVAG